MRKLIAFGILVLLAGCSGPSGQKPGEPKVDPAVLAALPPDPGDAGKITMAGIDADHDGVRDDVQRWIAIHYANSEKTRAALRQKAKALQAFIGDGDDPAKARRDAVAIDKASECLASFAGDAFYINHDFDAVVLNTYPRLNAYLGIDKKYGGAPTSDSRRGHWKQSCDFNPDAMKN
ncbi:MAG TPA: hypothetical protein VNH42_01940 [Mariprofundaceae bacterium]|nr:hypothetical protein [Mariprofundaceae bacterium]